MKFQAAAVLALAGCAVSAAEVVKPKIVSFKDAGKIKSWDAWNDHKKQEAPKERRCVTMEKLMKLQPPGGMKEIGRLAVRGAHEIKGNKWSIGCETMDRDYAQWDNYKHLLQGLGAKRGRLFSGWAKTEQEKNKYDFAWLDPQVREMAAMGVKPWICLSYGNPVWGSDFRLGMRVAQVTGDPEAFAAWIRYCKAVVERYKDVVDEWEIWNEPFGQAKEYAEMFIRTGRAIREVQPGAKLICTAITQQDYPVVLEQMKKENALDLGWRFAYHPYSYVPEDGYKCWADPLRKLVKSYSGAYDILQGEVGCPAQLEFAHALANHEWTEYSQAKWNLRRTIGDAVRAIPSSVFTMIDLQYTFMLQSFGLVRSNALKEYVYRRPSYFAMQNVFSYFDDDTLPQGYEDEVKHEVTERADPRRGEKRKLSCAKFTRFGRPVRLYWYSDKAPSADLEFDRVTVEWEGPIWKPVWVEMITGRTFEIPDANVKHEKGKMTITGLPVWDSPVMILGRAVVPLRKEWAKMSPREIVDSFYRPGQDYIPFKGLAPEGSEPWMKMKTEEFLPCIDKYGQFKHRDWPGKTKSDEQLKAAAEEEAKDLAANPGPKTWNKYGGWANGPQFEATGRFGVKKVDGKWWFIDPEGKLFWSFGSVRVTPSSAMTPIDGDNSTPRHGFAMPARDCFYEALPPQEGDEFSKFWQTSDALLYRFFKARGEERIYDFSSANLRRKYGEGYFAKWGDVVHRRLRSWGANTIANSSDLDICLMDRTPYAERVECHSKEIAGSHGAWWKFRDPWDRSFMEGVTAALKKQGRSAHDPWCIGFFIDNEINWGGPDSLGRWTMQSPADQPAKLALADWLKAKYGTVEALNKAWGSKYADWTDLLHTTLQPPAGAGADMKAFSDIVIDRYFAKTREAVKAFDAKLLYLGCRFAGRARIEVARACAKYCDVVSYNIYGNGLEGWRMPEAIDAPVLIGEFHFGATDRGPFGTGLIRCKDQNERAARLKAYVNSALANPQIVGVHWHQFSDQATTGRFDGEYFQVGWTDVCDTPYPETVKALREVGYPLYETRAAAKAE